MKQATFNRLAFFGGIGLAAIAGVATGGAAAGVVSALTNIALWFSGVGGNQAQSCFSKMLEPPPPDPSKIFKNHDIRALLGLTIRSIVATLVPELHERLGGTSPALKEAIELLPKQFVAEFDKANSVFAAIEEFGVPDLLTEFAKSEGQVEVLTPSDWQDFLDTVQPEMTGNERIALAESLHKNFGRILWNTVQHDSGDEGGKQGLAAVQLLYLSRILSAVEVMASASPPDLTPIVSRMSELMSEIDHSHIEYLKTILADSKSLSASFDAFARAYEADRETDRRVRDHQHEELKEAINAPRSIARVHSLRSPPRLFGRDKDLEELEAAVIEHGASGIAITAALRGLGGVGKTALGLALAHRLKGLYPDAQVEIDLRGFDPDRRPPLTPAEILGKVIQDFHPQAQLPTSIEDLRKTYLSVLNSAGRVLIFLDNAFNEEQVAPLTPPPGCMLLVTSRNQFSLPDMVTRNLGSLEPDKAVELLITRAPRLKEHAAEAAKLCGYLPLALQTFGGAVGGSRSRYPVGDLIAKLAAHTDGRLSCHEAAFTLSFEVLSPDDQRRWLSLGVFTGDFDLLAIKAVLDIEVDDSALAHLQTLADASLVEYDETRDRYKLHDLVREFCLSKLDDNKEDALRRRHTKHYYSAAAAADWLYLHGDSIGGLALFDSERAQIEASFEWLIRGGRKRDAMYSAEAIADLVDAVLHTGQELRFHPQQRIRWLEAQNDSARLIGRRSSEAASFGNLGIAHFVLGDIQLALECHNKYLSISREIGDHQGEASALGNIGIAWRRLGQPKKACEYYEQHLRIARDLGDLRGEARALTNLGNAFDDMWNPSSAIKYHERALAIYRLLNDLRGESGVLGNIGSANVDLGNYEDAIVCFRQYLDISIRLKNKSGEAIALSGLSACYHHLDDLASAMRYQQQALIVRRENGDRIGEAESFGSIGGIHQAGNELDQAWGCFQQQLQLSKDAGYDRGVFDAEMSLGNISVFTGYFSVACQNFESALEVAITKGFLYDQPVALGSLANAEGNLGKHAIAITRFEEAITLATDVGNSRVEAFCLFNMAQNLWHVGRKNDAILSAETAFEISEKHRFDFLETIAKTLTMWRARMILGRD